MFTLRIVMLQQYVLFPCSMLFLWEAEKDA